MRSITSAVTLLALGISAGAAQQPTQRPVSSEMKEWIEKFVNQPDEMYGKLLPTAELGNVRAQFLLGILLTGGGPVTVVPRDPQRSLGLGWIRKSASAGHLPAMSHLSEGYRRGRDGLPQDSDLADCYQRAALRLVDLEKCSELERTKGYTDQR